MPQRVYETVIDCRPDDLWEMHESVEALEVLTPPGTKVEIIGDDVEVRDGALHEIKVRKMGIPMIWRARISNVRPPHEFVDVAEKSPFRSWHHHHEFLDHADGTLLRDTVTYEMPFGFIGVLVDKLIVSHDIDRMFAYRHDVTVRAMRHKRARDAESSRAESGE